MWVCCSVSYHDIEMLGHWSGAAVVKSYLTGMPFEAVLARAGHPSANFLLARASVPIPDAVMDKAKQLVWPWAEEMLSRFEAVSWKAICAICAISGARQLQVLKLGVQILLFVMAMCVMICCL